MKKIRVMIVDDSAFMRKVISDIVAKTSFLELAGTARDGLDAIKKVKELKPDVITMDVEMPGMDGITAVGKIMSETPTPIVMLSSLTHEGAEATVAALANGAVDFIPKPGPSISLNMHEIEDALVEKILIASKTKIGTLRPTRIVSPRSPSRPLQAKEPVQPLKPIRPPANLANTRLVLIGTSTGGPKALHEVFSRLDLEPDSASLFIVQHMPAGFTASLAARLDKLSEFNVKEGEDGEAVRPGYAYVAPGGYQMEIVRAADGNSLRLRIHKGELVTGHRPSVDALFLSATKLLWRRMVAVIMTGMGSDGTRGLGELKKQGCKTIGESEETCVVYGMPRAAVEAGHVDRIVPLDEIAAEIKQAVNSMP